MSGENTTQAEGPVQGAALTAKGEESKDIVAKGVSDIVIPEGSWGAEGARAENIVLPRLMLMQGTSKAVENDLAKSGDIMCDLTNVILGTCREKDRKEVNFIPIMVSENWIVYTKTMRGDKVQEDYKEIVPFGPRNANWERDTVSERRDLSLDFVVLLENQIGDEMALPYVLSFRRTSYRSGRKLNSHFVRCAGAGKPPAAYTFALNGSKRQKEGQTTYYIWETRMVGETSPEHLKIAYKWWKTLNDSQFSISMKTEKEASTFDDSDMQLEPGETLGEGGEILPPSSDLSDLPNHAEF